MSWLTYILPVLAAAFVILLAQRWMPVFASERLPDGAAQGRAPFSFEARSGRLSRLDAVLCLVITALYAVTAFVGLGDMSAPQSWCRFTERGQYALVDLGGETGLGMIRYYPGLHTGEYRLELSSDGESWRDAGSLSQEYNDLFKWLDYSLAAEGVADTSARYVRITASAELDLGEIAFYDAEGNMLDADGFDYDAGCAALFDEQDAVPERPGYMNSTYFDEIYHARTALEHIENVYPYEITHPPLG